MMIDVVAVAAGSGMLGVGATLHCRGSRWRACPAEVTEEREGGVTSRILRSDDEVLRWFEWSEVPSLPPGS